MVIKRFKHTLGRIEFDLKFNYRITILDGLSGMSIKGGIKNEEDKQ